MTLTSLLALQYFVLPDISVNVNDQLNGAIIYLYRLGILDLNCLNCLEMNLYSVDIQSLVIHMSRDARKPVFGVSYQVGHKPDCSYRRWLEAENFGFIK